MEREKLLAWGKEIVAEIYEKMGAIEQCESMADAIQGLQVCFLGEDGNLIGLDKVLSETQMEQIREDIVKTIKGNSKEATDWMERLNDATMEPVSGNEVEEKEEESENNVVEEEPVKENTETVAEKKEPVKEESETKKKTTKAKTTKQKKQTDVDTIEDIQKKASELGMTYGQYMQEQEKKNVTVKKRGKKKEVEITEKELAQMYVRQGMTLQEIAEQVGADKKSVYEKVEEYGLKEPAGMLESERIAWEKRVMERYR